MRLWHENLLRLLPKQQLLGLNRECTEEMAEINIKNAQFVGIQIGSDYMKTFRELKRSLKSLFYFLPTIWEDRDWDHYFVYKLLAMKFKKMENYRAKDKYYMRYVGEDSDDKNIKIARILCERLANDQYLTNATIPFDKKFPEAFKGLYKDWTEKENTAFRKCSEHSNYMREQDKYILFNLLQKELDKWWD